MLVCPGLHELIDDDCFYLIRLILPARLDAIETGAIAPKANDRAEFNTTFAIGWQAPGPVALGLLEEINWHPEGDSWHLRAYLPLAQAHGKCRIACSVA